LASGFDDPFFNNRVLLAYAQGKHKNASKLCKGDERFSWKDVRHRRKIRSDDATNAGEKIGEIYE
jgi:hypothetical protein